MNIGMQVTETVTHRKSTTTTTTAVTRAVNEPDDKDVESSQESTSCAQEPKILLYESRVNEDDDQSNILTDDDTDSVGSSIDSKEIEAGLKEITQQTQENSVENIDTQMKRLSFISSSNANKFSTNANDNMHNLSHHFQQLDLMLENDNINSDQKENTNDEKNDIDESIQVLSSDDSFDHEPSAHGKQIVANEIIILSDSDDCEKSTKKHRKRDIENEPPLKPSGSPSENADVYNISPMEENQIKSLDSETMKKVNNFFDNIPFTVPSDHESSLNVTELSNSIKDPVYVCATSDEESIVEKTASETSLPFVGTVDKIQNEDGGVAKITDHTKHVDENNLEFSDNNIVVDIPVIKSSSDQSRPLIRSQSGVRLIASKSSPIIKTSAKNSECIRQSTNNVVLKNTGSSITVNSNNGQVNISAKININIQISPVEESSSEESSDDKDKKSTDSEAIQSNEEQNSNKPQTEQSRKVNEDGSDDQNTDKQQNEKNENGNKTNNDIEEEQQLTLPNTSESAKSPSNQRKQCTKNVTMRTPSTASKLKPFEYASPKSMVRTKLVENVFEVDKQIPVSAAHQELLYKIYGEEWKTPEVIKSYSAVKCNDKARQHVNDTPTNLNHKRYSKGFNTCKSVQILLQNTIDMYSVYKFN